MLQVVFIACLFVAFQGAQSSVSRHRNVFPNGKIVGGQQSTVEELPWQVALEDARSGYLFCGGSILSANYVLTAAHCTDGSLASDIRIRYGTSNLESGGSTVRVASIAQNANYSYNTLDYDVSVLQVANPLNLSQTAKPVVLRIEEAVANETARVSGWGTLNEGDVELPNNLQVVSIPIIARDVCNNAYGGAITERMICAGEAGKDSCQGDSGGAITINNQQVGIVSWGYGCALEGYPGVYSNVAALKQYINDNSSNETTWL